MIVRFCLYSVLKNLRFSDPFLAIYLIEFGFSYAQIGSIFGFEKLVTAMLEIPSGIVADRWGRRSVLAWSFACHAAGLTVLAIGTSASTPSTQWFYAGLGVYGIGEALRTGSHKAIMLDYLEVQRRAADSTAVLSLARTFSKTSSALAGITAGWLLYLLHDYSMLFWLSAAAATMGCGLILSYPKYLEGESSRRLDSPSRPFNTIKYQLTDMFRNPKMRPLLLRSLLYESQVEVLLKLFLQPFLYQGLTTAGLPLTEAAGAGATNGAPGSLLVGVNELFRDSLGAAGAGASGRVERRLPRRSTLLRVIYLLTVSVMVILVLAAALPAQLMLLGLGAIGVLTFLQNLRRPMFVSQLNEVANKPFLTTILSIDNQARSILVAMQLPLMGMLVDKWGLWTVAAIAALIMLGGALSLKHK